MESSIFAISQLFGRRKLFDFPLGSRIHPLTNWSTQSTYVAVKRDDELSCSISGSKMRKYTSLVPDLQSRGVKEVLAIGGSSSNNLLGLAQILRENGIALSPVLPGPPRPALLGNELLLQLALSDSKWIWVDRSRWQNVDEYCRRIASLRSSCEGNLHEVLAEGSAHPGAVAGVATLAYEIAKCPRYDVPWNHIFIDAGTGFTAAVTLVMLGIFQFQGVLHVVNVAGDKKSFNEQVIRWFGEIRKQTGIVAIDLPPCRIHEPFSAKSFGSSNREIFAEIATIAKGDGIFVDPVYGAKLFGTARRVIKSEQLKGNILIIHSGGALSLAGFQRELLESCIAR